ncbi:hypothetical protein OESDEN_09079 [Oesophagostomum dentatum]|uniref:Uncharacterized protein n=1 Tax=Oesophagostomum dentatum TaxID=61180 RepID=A0A0B1T4J0_OESDE|nr:hypothetical protein OESDEN_09079 [Oesophagostomum dentatum]
MLYRVNTVFGTVEPGQSARIEAEEGEAASREVFKQALFTEMMVLPLLVQD